MGPIIKTVQIPYKISCHGELSPPKKSLIVVTCNYVSSGSYVAFHPYKMEYLCLT